MSQTGFSGIQPAMLEYFVGIALNNYREYFLSTHKDYEQNVKKPLYALAEELVPYALKSSCPAASSPASAGTRALQRTNRPTAAICGCPFTR